jgi:ADP-L-glycero-D-manno-heptose 6-epimerase
MILITGAAGFVGRNLADHLRGKPLLLVDDATKQHQCHDLSYHKFYDYLDFYHRLNTDQSFHEYIAKNVQVIFHQGACTDTTVTDPHVMMFQNFEYSKFIFDFARAYNIRLIYASSAATYGTGDKGFTEDTASEAPLNIYGRSKYLFDEYVRCYMDVVDSQVVGLRYFNVYGPGEEHKGPMASVIHQFHQQAQQNANIRLFEGSENFLRDFVYIEDIIKINSFFLEREDLSGVYNAGSGTARSFQELADLYTQRYPDVEIETIDFPPHLDGSYQAYTRADLSKLLAAGYSSSFTSLETGATRYLSYLDENESRLR